MNCKGGRCCLSLWQVEIRQNPWVVFIIQTGHQLSAAQHNRRPGKSCDPEEYFLSVLKMAGDHKGNYANISAWFAVWLSGVRQHPAKWQSFRVAFRATKNQYFNCMKSSMTQLCLKHPQFWVWFFPGLSTHISWEPVISSQKWDLMACLPSYPCCFSRNCRGIVEELQSRCYLLNMRNSRDEV